MNRFAATADPHPLDEPIAARRLGVLRTLCQGIAAGLVVITAGVWLVVRQVFGGQPLAGNLVTLAGVSAVTVGAAVLTAVAVPVALWAGRAKAAAVLRELAARPEGDADQLLDAFAAGTFAAYAVAAVWGFLCAAVFHLTTDPLMIALVGVVLAVMAVRYPTTGRAKAWFDAAADAVARERRARTL